MAGIHLVEGPVGAGKSTFAQALAHRQGMPHINLDDWFATLFSPDRPAEGRIAWYGERKLRCLEQIWKLVGDLTRCGCDVVLELGLLTRAERDAFYQRAQAAGLGVVVTVLDAPREVRRARVQARNRERGPTFRFEVPDAFFDLASDRWEAPDDAECTQHAIRFVGTHEAHGAS